MAKKKKIKQIEQHRLTEEEQRDFQDIWGTVLPIYRRIHIMADMSLEEFVSHKFVSHFITIANMISLLCTVSLHPSHSASLLERKRRNS